MPQSFNDRAPTASGAPKPKSLGGAQGATNEQPSAKGAAAGGTDNIRAGYETYTTADSRPETSSLRATRAAVSRFAGNKP